MSLDGWCHTRAAPYSLQTLLKVLDMPARFTCWGNTSLNWNLECRFFWRGQKTIEQKNPWSKAHKNQETSCSHKTRYMHDSNWATILHFYDKYMYHTGSSFHLCRIWQIYLCCSKAKRHTFPKLMPVSVALKLLKQMSAFASCHVWMLSHYIIQNLDFVRVLYHHDAIRTDKFPMENIKQ